MQQLSYILDAPRLTVLNYSFYSADLNIVEFRL